MGAMLFFLEYVLLQREKYKGLMKKAGKLKDKLEKELESFIGSEEEKRHLLDEIRKAAEDKSAKEALTDLFVRDKTKEHTALKW